MSRIILIKSYCYMYLHLYFYPTTAITMAYLNEIVHYTMYQCLNVYYVCYDVTIIGELNK